MANPKMMPRPVSCMYHLFNFFGKMVKTKVMVKGLYMRGLTLFLCKFLLTQYLILVFILQRLQLRVGCVHHFVTLLFPSVFPHCHGWNHFHDVSHNNWTIFGPLSSITESTKPKSMVLCCSCGLRFYLAQCAKVYGKLFAWNSCAFVAGGLPQP